MALYNLGECSFKRTSPDEIPFGVGRAALGPCLGRVNRLECSPVWAYQSIVSLIGSAGGQQRQQLPPYTNPSANHRDPLRAHYRSVICVSYSTGHARWGGRNVYCSFYLPPPLNIPLFQLNWADTRGATWHPCGGLYPSSRCWYLNAFSPPFL
jgi:hypothetical protein